MAHLTGFGLDNFRVFGKETWFDFAPITVFTGTNSSGKSTVNKALLLMKENFKQKSYKINSLDNLSFKNNLKLGGFSKVANDIEKDIVYILKHRLYYFAETEYLIKYYYSKNNDTHTDDAYLREIKVLDKNSKDVIIDIKYEEGKLFYKFDFKHFIEYGNKLAKKSYLAAEECKKSGFLAGRFQIYKNVNYKTNEIGSINLEDEYFNEYELMQIQESKEVPKSWNYVDKLIKNKSISKRDYKLGLYDYNNPLLLIDFFKLIEMDIEDIQLEIKNNEYIKNIKEKRRYEKLKNFKLDFPEYNDFKVSQNIDYLKKIEEEILNNSTTTFFFGFDGDWSTPLSQYDYLDSLNIGYNIKKTKNVNDVLKAFYINELAQDNNLENRRLHSFIKDFILKNFNYSLHTISIANQIEYLSVDRAKNERLFQFQENDNSTLNSILLKYLRLSIDGNKLTYQFINKWVKELEIADSVEISQDREGLGAYVYLIKNGKSITLADVGFGVAQFLPILLKIVSTAEDRFKEGEDALFIGEYIISGAIEPAYRSSILVIEEPEINLHPALQSKLADMFVDATRTFNIQFIIETHSEYLIRRLQFLTAKKEIQPEDTIIHYLFPPDSEHVKKTGEQLRTIKIMEDGRLDKEFGTGFFDESTKLIEQIWNINSQN